MSDFWSTSSLSAKRGEREKALKLYSIAFEAFLLWESAFIAENRHALDMRSLIVLVRKLKHKTFTITIRVCERRPETTSPNPSDVFSFLIPIIFFLRRMKLKTRSVRSIERLEWNWTNWGPWKVFLRASRDKRKKINLPKAAVTASYLIVICLLLFSPKPLKLGHKTALIRSKTFIRHPQKRLLFPVASCL